ncbi:MAG: hypothetical protein KDB14_26530 [Planctomycetales bacterium]|nr:hypothetical protein [Planctomycetales bacterium]
MKLQVFFLGSGIFLTTLSAFNTAWAGKYLLQHRPTPTQSAHVQLEVRGHLLIDGKPASKTASKTPASEGGVEKAAQPEPKKLPLTIDGDLKYGQRLLPDNQGRRSAVRHYKENHAKVTVDGRLFQPQLQDQHRLIHVDVEGERVRFRSLRGPLSREELDLVEVQADPLLLHRLLPGEEVEVGAEWTIDGAAAAPIFGLDATYSAGLQAELKEVKQGVARILIHGPLDGASEGVPSRIDCQAELTFNVATRQILMFDLEFSEQRSISGGQPGIEAKSHLRVTLRDAPVPAELQDDAIGKIGDVGSAELLRYRAPKGEFVLMHRPQWRVVADSPKQSTLRLLESGDVIAQGNLSKLPKLPAGEQLTLEVFAEDVRKTLEKLEGEVAQVEESTLGADLRVLRVIGLGKVQDIDVQWVYLHLSDDHGNRVSCVFTLEKKQVEKFEGEDLALLGGLEFVTEAAQKPAQKERVQK